MNSVKDDVVHFENLSVGSLAYLLLATEGKVNSRRHNTYNKEKNRKRRRVSLKGKASWIYPVFVHSSYQMPLLYREEKGRSSIWNLLVTAELWATRENSKKVPKRSSSRIQVLDDPLQRAHTNAVQPSYFSPKMLTLQSLPIWSSSPARYISPTIARIDRYDRTQFSTF